MQASAGITQSISALFRPLPHLTFAKAQILRLLMIPNLLLLRSEGGERIDRLSGTPCIFAFNHNNFFESLFVPVFLMHRLGGRRVSFVIDWMFGYLPVIGWLMRQISPVYVYTKRSTLPFIEKLRPSDPPSVIEQCCHRLEEGYSIGIFPEGKRNSDPRRMLRARQGIGHIVLETGAPVIPVGIDFPASRRIRRVPAAGRIVLRIGEPIRFEQECEAYGRQRAAGNRKEMGGLASGVSALVMASVGHLCGKQTVESDHSFEQPRQQEATCPS